MDTYLYMQTLNTILDKLEKIEERIAKIKPSKSLEDNKEGFIDLEELCLIFNMSKDTVRRRRKEGIFPSYKVGGKIYFKLDEIKHAIKERYVYGSNRSQ